MNHLKIFMLVSGFWFLVSLSSGCQERGLYKDTQLLMGTFVEVVSARKEAAPIVFAEIRRIENLLSKYKPESELSRLNCTGKLQVSPETFFVLKKAKEFWQASSGAFDITVGPLVDLWGFTDKHFRIPEDNQIKETLRQVGSDKIILQEADSVVEFQLSGMKIDLGAIAKGYALDCAAKKLKEAGITRCLLNAGGQVYALGDKYGLPWKVAVRPPRRQKVSSHLELRNQSASTSGDYEQYFLKKRCRYSHILDPRTGYPAHSGISAVTVVAPEALVADALSTAIFVLGEAGGRKLLDKFPATKITCVYGE
jgi:thiamine biosynthesis lipoprotein